MNDEDFETMKVATRRGRYFELASAIFIGRHSSQSCPGCVMPGSHTIR